MALCVICGLEIPTNRKKSNSCSEACMKERGRQRQREYYMRQQFAGKQIGSEAWSKEKKRIASDPEYAKKYKQKRSLEDRKYREKHAEKIREYKKKYQQENREELKDKKRIKRLSRSQEEHSKYLEYLREYNTKKLRSLKNNPDTYARWRKKARAELQRHRTRKELDQLLSDSQKLYERKNNDEQ
jgi:predicted nucleic acid-binding Zn ribbon protein